MICKCVVSMPFAAALFGQHENNCDSFKTLTNTIVVTVFFLIMKETGLCLVNNQNGNCHYDHIRLNLKIIPNKIYASSGQALDFWMVSIQICVFLIISQVCLLLQFSSFSVTNRYPFG